MMKTHTENVIVLAFYVAGALGGICGWVFNIVKLCGADGMGGMEIARTVGIFVAPIGAVLGWL